MSLKIFTTYYYRWKLTAFYKDWTLPFWHCWKSARSEHGSSNELVLSLRGSFIGWLQGPVTAYQKMWHFFTHCYAGCSADLTGANGFVRPPLFDTSTSYPPSVTCTYIIHAPKDAQRAFQLYFNNSQLADAADSVKVLLSHSKWMQCSLYYTYMHCCA